MKLENLKSGMLIQHAQKLMVFIAPITKNKFYAYFVCSFPTADYTVNKEYLITYAKTILNDLLLNGADKERVIVTSVTSLLSNREPEINVITDWLDKDTFVSWYQKSRLLNNELPVMEDSDAFRERKHGVGKENLNDMEVGRIYRTEKGKRFMIYYGSNKFVVVPQDYLTDFKHCEYTNFKDYASNLMTRRFKMYYGSIYLYRTDIVVDNSLLAWIRQNYT